MQVLTTTYRGQRQERCEDVPEKDTLRLQRRSWCSIYIYTESDDLLAGTNGSIVRSGIKSLPYCYVTDRILPRQCILKPCYWPRPFYQATTPWFLSIAQQLPVASGQLCAYKARGSGGSCGLRTRLREAWPCPSASLFCCKANPFVRLPVFWNSSLPSFMRKCIYLETESHHNWLQNLEERATVFYHTDGRPIAQSTQK